MAHALICMMWLGTRSLSSLCMVTPPVMSPPTVSPPLFEMECLWISIRHHIRVMHKEKELPKGLTVTTEPSQAQPAGHVFLHHVSPAVCCAASGKWELLVSLLHYPSSSATPSACRQVEVGAPSQMQPRSNEGEEGRTTLTMGQRVKLDEGDVRERKTDIDETTHL